MAQLGHGGVQICLMRQMMWVRAQKRSRQVGLLRMSRSLMRTPSCRSMRADSSLAMAGQLCTAQLPNATQSDSGTAGGWCTRTCSGRRREHCPAGHDTTLPRIRPFLASTQQLFNSCSTMVLILMDSCLALVPDLCAMQYTMVTQFLCNS